MRFSSARLTVIYWKLAAEDEVACSRARRLQERRRFSITAGFEGAHNVDGYLPPVQGAIIAAELNRLERELFEQDLAAARQEWGDDALGHLPRTAPQRRADALEVMARRSAAMPADAKQARILLSVVIDHGTAKRVLCETDDGIVVHPDELRGRLADVDFERILFAAPDRVFVGPRTRLFTGALRRAIQLRDRHCQHPSGCDEPVSRCQIDHIIEYEDGGTTTLANGQLQCGFHNRWKHRNKNRPPPTNDTA
jgi:hypothetical protein